MSIISNPVFTQIEKKIIEFVLQHEFVGRDLVIEQLNQMNYADITRDVTPYYWIMEFRPNGINSGGGAMHPYIDVGVLHQKTAVETEFTLYERNGCVFELEIYNTDSSAINLDTIMEGKVFVR